MNIQVNNNFKYANLSKNSINNSNVKVRQNVSFTSLNPEGTKLTSKFFEPAKRFFAPFTSRVSKLYGHFTDGVAKTEAYTLSAKWLKNTINYSEKHKIDVVKHISSINGIVIAGLYIKKTMDNDKLDPEKKVTLSINQGIVAAVATVAGYLADGAIAKQVDKFSRKFMAVNYKANPETLGKLKGGLRAAASMMVFGTMYRYIAPVLVTPIANKIGNNVHEKKLAKLNAEKGIQAPAETKVIAKADQKAEAKAPAQVSSTSQSPVQLVAQAPVSAKTQQLFTQIKAQQVAKA